MVEHDWDYFDELVQALAARASDSMGLDNTKVSAKLLQLFNDSQGKKLTFDYLTSITAAEVSSREQNCRKLSWVLQHALGAKVWCVNSRLMSVRAGRLYSPVIEQIRCVGIRAGANRLAEFHRNARSQACKFHNTIDSVLLSSDFTKLYVVKGCSVNGLMGGSNPKRVRQVVSSATGTLWDLPQRVIAEPLVDAEACRTLVIAWGMLKDTFNHLEVIPVFCIVDDFDAGWHFQAHDLSIPCWRQFADKRVSLTEYPILTQSLDFIDGLRADSDVFNAVPSWAAGTPLYCVPPDRPARSLMTLDVLQHEQAGNSKEIVPVSEVHVAEQVNRRYDLFYTKDMRRHDLLHLQRRGLIVKHPGNSFSITPLGLARFHLAVAMAQGEVRPDFPQKILNRVQRQAELTWKYRGL